MCRAAVHATVSVVGAAVGLTTVAAAEAVELSAAVTPLSAHCMLRIWLGLLNELFLFNQAFN